MLKYLHHFLLLLSICTGIHLLPICAAKQPSREAVNNAKHLTGITQVSILPENLKPSKAPKHGGRRLIFIGDVHGAYDELVSLLEKVKYKSSTDHVVFLGDLVSKGPQSNKVVKLAMQLNASCVIGNHDYELLDWMGYINTVGDTFVSPLELPREFVLGEEQRSKGMGFSHEAAQWLLQCPFILKVGKIDGEELVAVHAGLFPGTPLEKQEPWTLMNMRNIYKGEAIKDTDQGDPWADLWNKRQRRLSHPTTVVYGHAARRGLQLKKHTKGLDTGCVRGGRLTALIYPGEEVISVKCEDYEG